MSNLIEVLSPAGSYESLQAAVRAGADAVYVGGSRFGARAFAGNFDEEELLRAIDYVHVHDKRLYLTVNTLIKEQEFGGLYDYLLPYYKEGLDAVIVQDAGVADFIRHAFPDMDLHASTQMTAMGVESARFLEELGFTRIVPARELSLEEIAEIKRETNLEIETFVHGALCVSYSGQCLMSSMLGGRSGNRGRCAQPCRLPYDLYANGTMLNNRKEQYLLSPRDLCSLEILPKVLKAGTNSLKIEGRMKRPQYVAAVTRQYRNYVDLYLDHPEQYQVNPKDFQELMELYNRGGFTKGYYLTHNGRDMMSMKRPNHMGYYVGKIQNIVKNQIRFVAETDIHKKDILEISIGKEEKVELTSPLDVKKGGIVSLNANKLRKLKPGMAIYRTRNELLIHSIISEVIDVEKIEELTGDITFVVGKPATLTLAKGDITVVTEGEVVQPAQKQPVTRDKLITKLTKTGNTSFAIHIRNVNMSEDGFLPMGAINGLRRDAIEAMEEALTARFRREEPADIRIPEQTEGFETEVREERQNICYVNTMEQAQAALAADQVDAIYLQEEALAFEQWNEFSRNCHKAGKEIYYSLPLVFHRKAKEAYLAQEELLKYGKQDGLLIHTIDELAMLRRIGYSKTLILDSSLYAYNQTAMNFYRRVMDCPIRQILPVELTEAELLDLQAEDADMVIYGRQPLMITAQCQLKNHKGCKKQTEAMVLRDRKHSDFPVRNYCRYCYNVIYNGAVLNLTEDSGLDHLDPKGMVYRFTVESPQEVSAILNGTLPKQNYTKGHFHRGVD